MFEHYAHVKRQSSKGERVTDDYIMFASRWASPKDPRVVAKARAMTPRHAWLFSVDGRLDFASPDAYVKCL